MSSTIFLCLLAFLSPFSPFYFSLFPVLSIFCLFGAPLSPQKSSWKFPIDYNLAQYAGGVTEDALARIISLISAVIKHDISLGLYYTLSLFYLFL